MYSGYGVGLIWDFIHQGFNKILCKTPIFLNCRRRKIGLFPGPFPPKVTLRLVAFLDLPRLVTISMPGSPNTLNPKSLGVRFFNAISSNCSLKSFSAVEICSEIRKYVLCGIYPAQVDITITISKPTPHLHQSVYIVDERR